MSRAIRSCTIAAVIFCIAVPAGIARDFSNTVEAGRGQQKDCTVLDGREQTRCMTDTIRQWNRERDAFFDALRERVKEWDEEHSNDDHADRVRARIEFMKEIIAERKDFLEQQRERSKELHEAIRASAQRLRDSVRKEPQTPVQNDSTDAEADCADRRGDAYRLCVRMQRFRPAIRRSMRVQPVQQRAADRIESRRERRDDNE